MAGHPMYAGTMWMVLTFTFFLTVYFTSGISQQLANTYRDLAMAYEELHAREATKSQFMRVVAHEMRSPLAAMISLVELLNSEEPADTVTQQVHRRIKARCEAMLDMVDDLLRLANVRAGGDLSGRPDVLDVARSSRRPAPSSTRRRPQAACGWRWTSPGAKGSMIEGGPPGPPRPALPTSSAMR